MLWQYFVKIQSNRNDTHCQMRSLNGGIFNKNYIMSEHIKLRKKLYIYHFYSFFSLRDIWGIGCKNIHFLMKNVNMKIWYLNKYFTFDRYIMIIFIVITFFCLRKSFPIKKITKTNYTIWKLVPYNEAKHMHPLIFHFSPFFYL